MKKNRAGANCQRAEPPPPAVSVVGILQALCERFEANNLDFEWKNRALTARFDIGGWHMSMACRPDDNQRIRGGFIVRLCETIDALTAWDTGH